MKCQNADCPCLCDNPNLHHRLAEQSGSAEVNPEYCAGLRKTEQVIEQRDALRARVAELERERDEAVRDHEDAIARLSRVQEAAEKARAEVERLRREYDVRAVIERCPQHDAPTLVDGYQKGRVRIVCSECCDEDNERLREALRGLLDAEPVAHHADLCDVVPCHECRARAALAGAPSESRREHDRALAERVREACIEALAESDGDPRSLCDLDLDALLGER